MPLLPFTDVTGAAVHKFPPINEYLTYFTLQDLFLVASGKLGGSDGLELDSKL